MRVPRITARTFTIIAAVVVVVVLLVLILLVRLTPRGTAPPPPSIPITPFPTQTPAEIPPTTLPSFQLPAQPPEAPSGTALPPEEALGAVIAADGAGLVGYNAADGSFYRVDPGGGLTILTDEKFPFAKKVTWAPDRLKAILEFPDEAKILYDFRTRKATTLPGHWREFSFAPTSDAIVFKSLGLDPENQWLAVASPEGDNVIPLEQLGDRAFLVSASWSPNRQVVGFYAKPIDRNRASLFFIGANRESYPASTIEGSNFLPLWSPSADRLLYSTATATNGWRPTLWTITGSGENIGGNRTALNVQTWADKCVFSANRGQILCAVPEELPEGVGLVRESVERTQDRIVQINLDSTIQRVVPIGTFDTVDHLELSNDGGTLFIDERGASPIKKVTL